jgi:FSR family fosmidomycin resistance protein-like MFS transporter
MMPSCDLDLAVQGKSLWLGRSALAAPALILIFLITPTCMIFPVLLLLGFTVFAASPVMLAIIQEHAHGMRATANGIYMGINFVVVSGITVLVGWIGDLVGLRAAFVWSAVLSLTGLPTVYFLPQRTKHEGQPT